MHKTAFQTLIKKGAFIKMTQTTETSANTHSANNSANSCKHSFTHTAHTDTNELHIYARAESDVESLVYSGSRK